VDGILRAKREGVRLGLEMWRASSDRKPSVRAQSGRVVVLHFELGENAFASVRGF
jgi:hypothetical protein